MINHLHEQNLECTGCEACANACPVSAIHMEPDTLGFYEAKIDAKACVDCGRCLGVCPVLNDFPTDHTDKPACYAAMAEDAIRVESSSGGAFTLLVETVLSNGGVAVGAAWSSDETVRHIFVDNYGSISKLRKSKYVQSRIGMVYQEVKNFLIAGRPVLFSGCPCQVAGLNAFLGRAYKNLLTVDILCHGVPSSKMLQEELSTLVDDAVTLIDFRPKSHGWKASTRHMSIQGGKQVEIGEESAYEMAFHNSLSTRDSCVSCKFGEFPRQGDLSIGDFWGIGDSCAELDDDLGTSVVFVNSLHGADFWEKVAPRFKTAKEVPLEWLKCNRTTAVIPTHLHRAYFQFLMRQKVPFPEAARAALAFRIQIGIVGPWMNRNCGGALTYYALYEALCDMGYFPVMISQPRSAVWSPDHSVCRYKEIPYPEYAIAPIKEDLEDQRSFNEGCNTFIVGSDQLFTGTMMELLNGYSDLEWVDSNKKMIAYAASFAYEKFRGTELQKKKLEYFISRFDAISVRERDGVSIVNEAFHLNAQLVLDPIFLCDIAHLERLAQRGGGRVPKSSYVFGYVLDPSEEMSRALISIAEKYRCRIVAATDCQYSAEMCQRLWGLDILEELCNEELVAQIKNSRFVITDSFHGVCLAIRFQKSFVVVVNKKRGASRFLSLLETFGLESRLFECPDDVINKIDMFQEIDYVSVGNLLEEERKQSLEWLRNAIEMPKAPRRLSDYDAARIYVGYTQTYLERKLKWEKDCLNGRVDWLIGHTDEAVACLSQTDSTQWKQLEDHRLRLDGLDAQMADALRLSCEASNTDAEQWKQLEDHRLRLDSLDAQMADASRLSREASVADAEQWKQLEDHRQRLDGLDAQIADASRLSHEATTTDAEQWKQLEDHRLRLDGLDAQVADASRLGCEASTADAEQWKQLEDHRQRLDGLDAKIIESAVLVDATKAELSEQISRLKELIFVLEQQNAELQSEVKRLAESSLRSRLKKVFHQMMFWT